MFNVLCIFCLIFQIDTLALDDGEGLVAVKPV